MKMETERRRGREKERQVDERVREEEKDGMIPRHNC